MQIKELTIKQRQTYQEIASIQAPIVEGIKKCLNCGADVPPTNHKYCSLKCANEFYAKHNQAGLRQYVFERESGKCQKCGWINKDFPTPQPTMQGQPEFPKFPLPEPQRPGWIEGGVVKHMAAMRKYNKNHQLWKTCYNEWLTSPVYKKLDKAYEKARQAWNQTYTQQVLEWNKKRAEWEKTHRQRKYIADHIIPIALGGPEFDLNNIQLLCDECNKIKTAKDAADIAKRRKLLKRIGILKTTRTVLEVEEIIKQEERVKQTQLF